MSAVAMSAAERDVLRHAVREAYMEIFPSDTIESKLGVLEPGSYIAVTCSPTRGVDVTIDMCARLAQRGFKVVPHVAAKMVRNRQHLAEIIARLDDLPIEGGRWGTDLFSPKAMRQFGLRAGGALPAEV